MEGLEERLQEDGGERRWTVVRLFQCITGPRVRRQFYAGWDSQVRELSGDVRSGGLLLEYMYTLA